MKKLLVFVTCALMVYSCKKDTKTTDPVTPAPVTPETGNVKISFSNRVDSVPLVYGTNYKRANGDTFVVSKFIYYISNVVLTRSDGTKIAENESYHLINHASASTQTFTLSNIPAGTYKSISYMIGVDSTRNVSGVQDFDLAPSKGMFWSWSTGYIMLKLEGTSPQSGNASKLLTFHIGGFSGATNVIKKVNINFPTDLIIASNKNPELKLKTNAAELFKGPNAINFATLNNIMSIGPDAVKIAENYADMTSFDVIVP